jgi:hypothetical protein
MTATVQVSGKLPDGRIYVIGGDTFDAFYANALEFFNGDPNQADRLIEDGRVALLDPPSPQRSQPAASSGPATNSAPPPGGPSCMHGPRRFKEAFTSKAGKALPTSWQCPSQDRSDQCKPVWNDN